MVADQIDDSFPGQSTSFEPLQDRLGHLGAFLRMPVKSDASSLPPDTNRLPNVMQKTTIRQRLRGRGQVAEGQHRMSEHIALGVIVGGLIDAFHRLRSEEHTSELQS